MRFAAVIFGDRTFRWRRCHPAVANLVFSQVNRHRPATAGGGLTRFRRIHQRQPTLWRVSQDLLYFVAQMISLVTYS